MEQVQLRILRGRRPSFDELPATHRRTVFGEEFAHVKGLRGGNLFLTRSGWKIAEQLLPAAWFDRERYLRVGRALPGATGAVYRVPVPHPARRDFALVVKFNRFAQDPPVVHDRGPRPFNWGGAPLEDPEFLSPFEEVRAVAALRSATGNAVRAARPLAIYSPPTRYPTWQLGRDSGRRGRLDSRLAADQASSPARQRVTYEWDRIYIVIYQWVGGIDLEEAHRRGFVGTAAMEKMTSEVADIVLGHGFVIPDHKARHIIVRPTAQGGLAHLGGRIAWALIDFELLQHAPLPLGDGTSHADPRDAFPALPAALQSLTSTSTNIPTPLLHAR